MKKLIDWSSNVIEKYFRSFDNEPVGYSRTKLVAYAFAAMTMIIQWSWLGLTVMTHLNMLSAGNSMLLEGKYELATTMLQRSIEAWDMLEMITIINVSTILSLLGIKAYFKKKDDKTKLEDEPKND